MRGTKRSISGIGISSGAVHCEAPGCSCAVSKQTYIVLLAVSNPSCNHLLCAACFAIAVAEKGVDRHIKCPSCCLTTDTWDVYKFTNRRLDPTRHTVSPPNSQFHPLEYYANQTELYRKDKALVTVSVIGPSDPAKTRHYQTTLVEGGVQDGPSIDSLASIGQTLHPYLISRVERWHSDNQ